MFFLKSRVKCLTIILTVDCQSSDYIRRNEFIPTVLTSQSCSTNSMAMAETNSLHNLLLPSNRSNPAAFHFQIARLSSNGVLLRTSSLSLNRKRQISRPIITCGLPYKVTYVLFISDFSFIDLKQCFLKGIMNVEYKGF